MANRPLIIVIDNAGQIWTPGDRVTDPDGRVLGLLSEIAGSGLGGADETSFGAFGGDGSDGAGPAVTGTLDPLVGGKQFNAWNLPAGQTLGLLTQPFCKIGVQGLFTLGGTLNLPRPLAGGGGALGGYGATTAASGSTIIQYHRRGAFAAMGGGGGGSTHQAYAGNGGRIAHLVAAGGVHGLGSNGGIGVGRYHASNDDLLMALWWLYPGRIGPGTGGGGGAAGLHIGDNGGNAGPGCACLSIECGSFDFQSTGIIDARGGNASTTGTSSSGVSAGGGGAGGGAGIVLVRTNTIVNNLGLIRVTGGVPSGGGSFPWGAGTIYGGTGGHGGDGAGAVVQV